MTGQDLKDFVEELIDDSLTDEAFLALVNNAKTKFELEGGRDWEILKSLETFSNNTSGNSLDANYLRTLSLLVDKTPYYQIPFEQQRQFANSAQRWYLDLRNNKLYLIGTNIAGTVYHFFLKGTSDIALATEISVWPARFHRVFGFEAAKLFFAINQGERGRSWDDKWDIEARLLKNAMIDWDVALNRRASENALQPDQEPELDIGLL